MQPSFSVRRWQATFGWVVSVCLWVGFAKGQSVSLDFDKSSLVNFENDVVPILDRRCVGCHSGSNAKGGFKIDDRETVLGYIEPGLVENSLLWTDYLNAKSPHVDPATIVMPLCGPLSTHELEVIESWIKEGAVWPESFRFVSTEGIPTIRRPISPSEGFVERMAAFLGYFHPAVVHFPIALLIFGGAAAALSFLTGGRAVYVAFYCLVWGTLFSIVAAFTGWCLADEKGYPNWTALPTSESITAAAAVYRHRWLGIFCVLMSIMVLGMAIIANRNPSSSFRHVWRIGFIVLALVASIVGHQGGELVYGDIFARAFARLLGN